MRGTLKLVALLGLLPLGLMASAPQVEGAENTFTAWTMSGLWHVSSSSCAGAHSGSRSFYFGQESQCDYDNGQLKDGALTSPSLFITGSGDTNFSFWTKWQVESLDPSCYDQLWIERYDSASSSWLHFADVGPVSDPPSSAPEVGVASVTGLGGNPEWQFVQMDLSAFAGSTMQLRFRFLSSACMASGCAGKACGAPDADYDNFLGWVVDDISFGAPSGALSIAKSASVSYASRGQALSYVINVKNLDPAPQTLTVWDTLPTEAVFSSAAPAAIQSGQLLSWSLALPGLGTQALTVQVSVASSAPYPSDWLNTASGLSSALGSVFTSPVSHVKIRDTTLQLSKSANPQTLTSGDELTFTLALSNFTAASVPQTDLSESYPVGFVEQGTEPAYSGFRTWSVLSLLPGETRYFTVWGFANGFNGQVLTNQATASATSLPQATASASVKLVRPEVPQLSVAAVYPNPAPSGKAGLPQSAFVVYESNQAMDLTLDIFTITGEKVRSIAFRAERGRGQVEWDLNNSSGAAVASGIFIGRLWRQVPDLGLIEAWANIAVLR